VSGQTSWHGGDRSVLRFNISNPSSPSLLSSPSPSPSLQSDMDPTYCRFQAPSKCNHYTFWVIIFLLLAILLVVSVKGHAQQGNFPVGGSSFGTPPYVTGQVVTAINTTTAAFASAGIPLCNGGAVIAASPYTLLADSASATRDRTSLCVVSTAGAGTFHVLAGSTTGVGANFSFGFLNDGVGSWTVDNNAGSDTFNVADGSTAPAPASSFTVTTGQWFSITNSGVSNGSGGVTWYVRKVTGGGTASQAILGETFGLNGANGLDTGNTTYYVMAFGSAGGLGNPYNTTESVVQAVLPVACTAKNLWMLTGGGAGSNKVITLRRGGVDTALTVSLAANTSGGDTTHSVALSAGDLIDFSLAGTSATSATVRSFAWTCQ
jgi:hypothetical protein